MSRSRHQKLRTALYVRVSTRDRQETANQLRELRRFAATQGWRIVDEFIDRASGVFGPEARPEFARMFDQASRGKFDVVLFWSLDRFSREGARDTLNHLNRLEECRVRYRSFTQPFFDTAGPFREALVSILAALAAQEQMILRERVRSGMARAAANGVKFGRPRRVIDARKAYLQWRKGSSLAELARGADVSKATMFRRIQNYERTLQTNEPTAAGAGRRKRVEVHRLPAT
jgi:DNA invertase Pin-like site-specific DNA recombinase